MEEFQPYRLILSQQFKIVFTSWEFGRVWKMLTLFTLIFPLFTHFLLSRFNMIVIMEIEIGNTIGTRFCCNLSKCKASLSFLKVKETFWEIHFQSQKLNEAKVNFCLSDGVARSKLVKTNFSNELFSSCGKFRFYWKDATLLYHSTWAVHVWFHLVMLKFEIWR